MPPTLNLRKFSGLRPRETATNLPITGAVVAENCDFSRGDLRPVKSDFKLRDLAFAARALFSQDGLRFYAWPEDVDCAMSPMGSGAANDRLYYTTQSDFRVTPLSLATTNATLPTSSYRVGVPRPTVAMQITVEHPAPVEVGTATVSAEPKDTYDTRLAAAQKALADSVAANTQTSTETRVYTYAYVNNYGEQGGAAPPVLVDVKSQTYKGVTKTSKVTLQVTIDPQSDYAPITAARVFRTASGGANDAYYFVMELSASTPKVTAEDAVKGSALNEPFDTNDAYPPDPALSGLVDIGNGILAAFKGRELWFSDAYRPWSWPPRYMKTLRHNIVGIMPYGTGLLATTVGSPSAFSGITPDAMGEIPISTPQAGVSKWALITIDGRALYASNDGIVAISGTQPDMALSERYFTREVWRERYVNGLSTMQFAHYDGKLVVFSRVGAFKAFMLDLDESAGEMTDLPNLKASAALVLTTSDQMYIVNGSALYQFGGGPYQELTYTTGDIVLPAPTVLAAAEIECTAPVELRIYQSDVLGYTVTVPAGRSQFRLPGSQPIPGHNGLQPSDRWQFSMRTTGQLKWLKGAPSMAELKEV